MITVSGTLQEITSSASTNSFVRFWLRGTGGNQPFVSGTALLAPEGGNTWYADFLPNGSGVVSGSLYSTSDVTVGGVTGAIWYGMQVFQNGYPGPESPVSASANININSPNILTNLPVVAAPTGDSTYLRLDGTNSPVTGGPVVFSSGVTTKVVNGSWFYSSQYSSLQAAVNAASGAVLYVDQSYSGLTSLSIPRKTTIQGYGGQSVTLTFTNTSGSSITIASPTGSDYVVMRDLNIVGPVSGTSIGADLTNAGIIRFENCVIKGFSTGIYGNNATTVLCDNCNVSSNLAYNYHLQNQSNTWWIRNGLCSSAGTYGVYIESLCNNNVVTAVRFESNALAFYNVGDTTTVGGCRFESNSCTNDASAINLTRLGNYYSTASWTDNASSTTVIAEAGLLNGPSLTTKKLLLGTTSGIHHGEFFADVNANLQTALLMANKDTSDGATFAKFVTSYGSLVFGMFGSPTDTLSKWGLYYENAGSNGGAIGTGVFLGDENGKVTTYNSQLTAGVGLTTIVGSTSQKSETSADNVLSITPLAVAASYRLRFVLSVSSATSAVIGWTATWKDSNSNAQSPTNMSLIQLGTAAPALTFTTSVAGNYYAEAYIDADNSATAIVIKLTLASGTLAAKASATIERLN